MERSGARGIHPALRIAGNPFKAGARRSGGRDAHFMIRAWQHNEEKIIVDHAAHWYTINKIKHLPEVNMIVTASRDKTFRLWDDQTYQPIKTIDVFKDGHHHSINTLLWIAESKILLTAGDDRIINMWQL